MARLQRSYWLQEVLNLQYDTWGYFTSARRLAESSFICCIEPENNQKRYDTKNWQIGSCLKVCFWGEMFIVFLLFNCWSSWFEWTFVSSEALLTYLLSIAMYRCCELCWYASHSVVQSCLQWHPEGGTRGYNGPGAQVFCRPPGGWEVNATTIQFSAYLWVKPP